MFRFLDLKFEENESLEQNVPEWITKNYLHMYFTDIFFYLRKNMTRYAKVCLRFLAIRISVATPTYRKKTFKIYPLKDLV